VFNFNETAIDFVHATYLTGRDDTVFWKFMQQASKKSDKLDAIIELTKHRLSRATDFDTFFKGIGQSNWNYTLQVMNIIDKEKIQRVFNTLNINEPNVDEEFLTHKTYFSTESINNNYMNIEQLNDYFKDVKNERI